MSRIIIWKNKSNVFVEITPFYSWRGIAVIDARKLLTEKELLIEGKAQKVMAVFKLKKIKDKKDKKEKVMSKKLDKMLEGYMHDEELVNCAGGSEHRPLRDEIDYLKKKVKLMEAFLSLWEVKYINHILNKKQDEKRGGDHD